MLHSLLHNISYQDNQALDALQSNIGVILYAVQEYDLALKFLEHSLQLHQHYNGKCSLKCALINHLIARAHSCRGDFRTALMYERETWSVYKAMVSLFTLVLLIWLFSVVSALDRSVKRMNSKT